MGRNLKLKGAYWTPDATRYFESIGEAQPPAWHKDLGNLVSIRAAIAAMVHGVDPETFIRMTTNPYDFMCRMKARRSDQLFWGGEEIQKTTRYYVSTDGKPMVRRAPPTGPEGRYKRKNGVTEAEYLRVMGEVGWQWDERVCTKNQSIYTIRENAVQAGFLTTVCNHVDDFRFDNINYDYYLKEANKLIIS